MLSFHWSYLLTLYAFAGLCTSVYIRTVTLPRIQEETDDADMHDPRFIVLLSFTFFVAWPLFYSLLAWDALINPPKGGDD